MAQCSAPASTSQPRASPSTPDPDRGIAELVIEACPPSQVRAWFSPGLAAPPHESQFGVFALALPQPASRGATLPWQQLGLPSVASTSSGGAWRHELRVGKGRSADQPIFVQALLVDPDEPFEGTLTAPVRTQYRRP